MKESEVLIPANIFWDRKKSFLESIVCWFREEKGMRYSEIGKLLDRDERNIWTTHDRARKKAASAALTCKVSEVPISDSIVSKPSVSEATVSNSIVQIPVSATRDRELSIMESVVHFLREEAGMSNQQVAEILRRSRKTVSTVYVRAKKKKTSKKETDE